MVSSTFSTLFLGASLCSAAALGSRGNIQRSLGSHEALLYGKDGRVEVWNKTEILSLDPSFFSGGHEITLPERRDIQAPTSAQGNGMEKRDNVQIIIENPDHSFLGDDMAMSSIAHAPATSTVTIAVAAGYNIANSINVGQSYRVGLEDWLDVTTHIDYTATWTSTQSTTNTFTIDKGKYGVVVSNANTFRKSGTIWSGRIGSPGTSETYTADSFTSKAYNGLEWVEGVISLCQSDKYPIPKCRGSGVLN